MSNPAWTTVLQDIVRRERQSLLQYVPEAYPWAKPGDEAALAKLLKMVEAEQGAAARLAKWLERRHMPVPPTNSFPFSFTTLNFVSVDFLIPRLVEEQRQNIAALEKDKQRIGDADVRQQVQAFIDLKSRHLQTLEEFATPAGNPVHV
jgi:hypothetical protein